MTIYVDILFITNLYIDFILLICVRKFLRINCSVMRMLCGSAVGACCSLISLYQNMPTAPAFFLSLISALFITLAAFAKKRWQMMLKITITYWIFSFIFAGFFFFIYYLFTPNNLIVQNGIVYMHISPAFLFAATLLAYLAITIFRRIFQQSDINRLYEHIEISDGASSVTLFCKADTGNNLREPFSGLPVIVAEKEALKDLFPSAVSAYSENGISQNGIRLIPFSSLGGDGLLPAFQANSVKLKKKNQYLKCYIAVCDKKLSSGQFNAIYNPDILSETYEKTKL